MYNFATDCHLFFTIICLVFIDQGDGHWKEKDRENLRQDIELYRNLAEKIEHEIENFYEKYPDEGHKEEITNRINFKHLRKESNQQQETEEHGRWHPRRNNEYQSPLNNVTNGTASNFRINEDSLVKETLKNNHPEKNDLSYTPWPKFENILLAMGKKYDWKNDRWIKLKRKFKIANIEKNTNVLDNNSIEFHEKHKFSYKIVRLSKSNSKRNVVVAVTAVR